MFDLGRTFLASVERSPDATAIVDGGVRLSYAHWFTEICRVRAGIEAIGLKRGEHLLAVLQNRLEMATLHWACQFAGIVMTPLNWRSKADEVEYCALDSEARAVAFQDVSAESVADSKQAQRLPRIAVGGVQGGTVPFEALGAAAPTSRSPAASADDVSIMLYTSGTTGRPKGVPRRHRQERAAALAHVAQNLYLRGERTLGVMPLYHTMGIRSLLAMALTDGCFVCLPRFDVQGALALIERERISNLYLVPTLYHDLVTDQSFAGTDVRSVRKLGFAGATMPDGVLKRVVEAFNPDLFV
ncbi:MAG TPA: AMP-binding protein, partial [Candidatus Cybelea sp.]|nr:AMP-binding protein [Candidatus Cybelea sp.]